MQSVEWRKLRVARSKWYAQPHYSQRAQVAKRMSTCETDAEVLADALTWSDS